MGGNSGGGWLSTATSTEEQRNEPVCLECASQLIDSLVRTMAVLVRSGRLVAADAVPLVDVCLDRPAVHAMR